MEENGETMWRSQFAQSSEMVPYPTCQIIFLPVVKELVNKSNGSYNFEGLWEFMVSSPSFNILSVSKIKAQNMMYQMEKLQKSHQEMVKMLEEKMQLEKEELKTQLKTMERKYQKKMEQEVENRKQEILRYNQKIEREREESEKKWQELLREREKREQELAIERE